MDTKNEILKNALNEAQINYYKSKYTQIQKQKERAETIFRQSKNSDEFIEQLNGMDTYRDTKDKEGNTKRGLSQFLKTEEQRDLLVAAWIVANSGDEALMNKYNIEIDETDVFNDEMRKIVSQTREAAVRLNKKSPSPEEVKKYRDKKERGEDMEDDEEEGSEDSEDSEKDSEDSEDSEKDSEEVDASFPPKDDDEESDEEDEGEDEEDEPKPKKKSVVDEKKFPSPKSMAEKIESEKEENLNKIDDLYNKIKEPTKSQKSAADNAKDKLSKSLDKLIQKTEGFQKGYENHPTSNSAMRASTNAKKAYSDAKREINNIVSKFERSQMPSFAGRQVTKGKEAIAGAKNLVTKAGKTRAALTAKDAAKRGIAASKEKIKSVQQKAQENKQINTVGNFLGKEVRNKYVEAIQDGNEKAKKEIEQQLEQARQKQKQGKEAGEKNRQERLRQERLEKMKESNQALKNYLEERKDPTIKPGKEFETVAKNLDPNSAKKYKELSTSSSIEDRKKAPELLAKAAEAKKKKEEELKQQEQKTEQDIKEKPGIPKNESRNSIIRKALKKPLYS